MEMLVGKIFDLAFMPAMNGERVPVPPGGTWPGDRVPTGLLGVFDAQPVCLDSKSESFLLS